MSNILSFFVQQDGQPDDAIHVHSMPKMADMFRVKYVPSNGKHNYTFYMDRYRLENYVYTMLRTLAADAEPFTYFQVSSAIAPSILYNIPDLEDDAIRRQIMDMVGLAMLASPVKNERS